MSVGRQGEVAAIAGIETLTMVASIMTIETPRLMKPSANQRLRPVAGRPAGPSPSCGGRGGHAVPLA